MKVLEPFFDKYNQVSNEELFTNHEETKVQTAQFYKVAAIIMQNCSNILTGIETSRLERSNAAKFSSL